MTTARLALLADIATLFAAVLIIMIVGGDLLCGCAPPVSPEPVAEAVPSASPAPAPPPCIRESCAERPAGLVCASWRSVSFNTPCACFRITYERHCDCIEWASPTTDGGSR